MVPQPMSAGSGLQCRGPGPLPCPEQQGLPQALPTLGGAIRHHGSTPASAYKLKTIDGEVFTNAWNIEQLRHFYP